MVHFRAIFREDFGKLESLIVHFRTTFREDWKRIEKSKLNDAF